LFILTSSLLIYTFKMSDGVNATYINPVDLTFFGFKPNIPISIAAIVVFAILTLILLGLNVKFKAWFFMILPLAGAMETIGFLSHTYCIYHPNNEPSYILFMVPVLLAPTVFAAADYTLVSKLMMKSHIPKIPPIFTPSVVRYLFLVVDLLAFCVQGLGGGLLASKSLSVVNTGRKIMLGGLCITLMIFVFFLFLTVYLHYRIIRDSHIHTSKEDQDVRWKRILVVLYVDMILLITRAIYRLVEFSLPGYHNRISTDERYFYSLDTLLMIIIMILWMFYHPGFHGMIDSDNVTDVEDLKTDEELKEAVTIAV